MNKKAFAVCMALLAWSGLVSAQTPAQPRRSITQVAGDVYRFQNNDHFGVFMVTPKGVLVVDPLSLEVANWLKGEIATRFNGARVVEVLYSHFHWDHAAGAAAFPGAKIVSRTETLKALAPPVSDARALETFNKQYANVLAPTHTYSKAVNRLRLGGKTVEMHHMPGNHADDMSYIYFPKEKILFVVDDLALQRVFYRNMEGFDEQQFTAILDKVLSFDTAFIVGGHGAIGGRQDVLDQRQYLNDLRQGVQDGISQGLSLEQIKAQLTLDKYSSWLGFAAWRSMNIEGMYAYLTKK